MEQPQMNERNSDNVLEFDPSLHSKHTPNGTSIRAQVLNEALDIIQGDRHESYGDPEDNFRDIANYWTTYLRTMTQVDNDGRVMLEPHNVADMMILMKVARNQFAPKWDNYVDIAGYAGCGAEAAKVEK